METGAEDASSQPTHPGVDPRVGSRRWILALLLGVTILANGLAAFFLVAVILPIMGEAGRVGGPSTPTEFIRDGAERAYRTLNTVVVFVAPFSVATALTAAYTWPAAFGRSLTERGRRRRLSLPVVDSLIGMAGWGIAAMGSLSLDLVYLRFASDAQRAGTIPGDTVINLSTGILALLITYYILDNVHRRWVVPRYFLDGRLQRFPGVARISIPTRFGILFFSISILPVSILVTGIAASPATRQEIGRVLGVSGGLLLLGGAFPGSLRAPSTLPWLKWSVPLGASAPRITARASRFERRTPSARWRKGSTKWPGVCTRKR